MIRISPKPWIRPADSINLPAILDLWQASPENDKGKLSLLEEAFWSPSANHHFLIAVDRTGEIKGWAALLPIVPPDGASKVEANVEICLSPGLDDDELKSRLIKSICAYSISTDLRTLYAPAGLFTDASALTARKIGWQPMQEIPGFMRGQDGFWAFRVPKLTEGPVEIDAKRMFSPL